jgi:hypothetical protein
MKQLKVALSDALRTKLDFVSKKSGKSVAEEIRTRLETSFERDVDVDKSTTDFLENVARMPAEIERETGANWHQHAGSHGTFVRAILSRLEVLKPPGSTVFGDRPHATTSEADPDKLGVMIEFRLRRQPDFTTSGTRKLLEEEHQRSRVEIMGSPRALLDTPQQLKPDKPKRRKKS